MPRGRNPTNISPEDIRRVYLDDPDASIASAAAELGVGMAAFYNALRRHGLPAKSGTRHLPRKPTCPEITNREWLLGKLQEKTAGQLAVELGVRRSTIQRWIARHGLGNAAELRASRAERRAENRDWTRLTAEQIVEAYHDDPEATMASAAKVLGCCIPVLAREMKRLGLTAKDKSRNFVRRTRFPQLNDAEWLKSELTTKSLGQVATELGSTVGNVRHHAYRHGVLIAEPERRVEKIREAIMALIAGGNGDYKHGNYKHGRYAGKKLRVKDSIEIIFDGRAVPEDKTLPMPFAARPRRTNKDGYIDVCVPEHPRARGVGGYVREHRLVMEQYVNRTLEANEIPHHVNGKAGDNRIQNLILTTKRDHHRIHYAESHAAGGLREENAGLREENAALRAEIERLKSGSV